MKEEFRVAMVVERHIKGADGFMYNASQVSWALYGTFDNLKDAEQFDMAVHKASEKLIEYDEETGVDKLVKTNPT